MLDKVMIYQLLKSSKKKCMQINNKNNCLYTLNFSVTFLRSITEKHFKLSLEIGGQQ